MEKSYNTGIASEYLVMSQLYRLGLNASISLANKKAIDIYIYKEDGTYITIDVKSVSGYSSIPVNNIIAKENHFVICVIYNNRFTNIQTLPTFFIVPSSVIAKECGHFRDQKRIMQKHILDYKDHWEILLSHLKNH